MVGFEDHTIGRLHGLIEVLDVVEMGLVSDGRVLKCLRQAGKDVFDLVV